MDLTGSWRYVQEIARQRLEHNITKRHVSDYGTGIELLGAAGELAARRFLGLDEHLHTHLDDGVDIRWRGHTIDVKTTHLTPKIEYRFLQWTKDKPVVADLVLMAAVNLRTKQATILGYTEKNNIMRAPINYTRDYPCHEVPVRDLKPAWELLVLDSRRHKHAYQYLGH
jgi:hypothetical protein